jgi:cell division septation protein DedD
VEPPPDSIVVETPSDEPYPEPTIIFEEEGIPVEPEPEEEIETQAPSYEYGFRVQVLASTSEKNAEGFAGEIRSKVDDPVYVEYIPPYHKVRVGDFTARADAEACRDRLRRTGYSDAFVVEALVNVP